MLYEQVFNSLQEHRVRCLVVGGLAVNLHGVPRMTIDLDILVDIETGNLNNLLTALSRIGYRPRLPVNPEDLLDASKRELRDKFRKGLI